MEPRPTFIGGTFHVDRIAERKISREKYYGFPLADAPFFVPFLDFRQEPWRQETGDMDAGLEIIGPGSFEKMQYSFDSGYDYNGDHPLAANKLFVQQISETQEIDVFDSNRNEITFEVRLGIDRTSESTAHIASERPSHLWLDSDDLKPQDPWRRSQSTDPNLGEDLLKFYDEAINEVLTIVVGENEDQKSFQAHKGLLMARSEYFRSFFESGMKDSRENMVTFDDLKPEAFGLFLKFLYSGALPKLDLDKAMKLWVVANRFLSSTLEKMCEGVIIQELRREVELRSASSVSAIIECLTFAHDYGLSLLLKSCQLYAKGSLRLMAATEEWRQFERERPELVDLVLQSATE